MLNLTKFFVEVDKLKRTYRFSTRDKLVHDSVADHSWKLALMTISVAERLKLEIDIFHSVKLALYHDLQEYITGEIDSRLIHEGKFSKEKKFDLERKALEDLSNRFENVGRNIYNLWEEFEEGKTREARYVKALDKIEAITHMISVDGVEKDDFSYTALYANESVKNFPELKPLLREVQNKLKKECEKIGEEWKEEYNLN